MGIGTGRGGGRGKRGIYWEARPKGSLQAGAAWGRQPPCHACLSCAACVAVEVGIFQARRAFRSYSGYSS